MRTPCKRLEAVPARAERFDDVVAVLGMLGRQIEAVNHGGSFYRQRVDQLKEPPPEVGALDTRLGELQAEVQQLSGLQARLAAERREAERWAQQDRELGLRLERVAQDLAALPGAHYDEARHRFVQGELAAIEPLVLEAERHRALAGRAAALASELTAARTARETASARVGAVRAELDSLAFSREHFARLEQAVSTAEQGLAEARHALVRAQATVTERV